MQLESWAYQDVLIPERRHRGGYAIRKHGSFTDRSATSTACRLSHYGLVLSCSWHQSRALLSNLRIQAISEVGGNRRRLQGHEARSLILFMCDAQEHSLHSLHISGMVKSKSVST